jgi:hypothetical protein
MSPTQASSGRLATKRRSIRSGAGAASIERQVVLTRRLRRRPWMPSICISRRTRLPEQRTSWSKRNSARILGTP